MKLLLLTNQLDPGGAEVWTVTVASALAERGHTVSVIATPGPLQHRIPQNVDHVPLDLRDLRLSLPVVAARLRKVVRARQPEALVASSVATTWAARLAAPRRPLVSVVHGHPAGRYPLVARLLRIADRVVAVSEDVGQHLADAGLAGVDVIRNGIDPGPPREAAARRERHREALGLDGACVVGAVGRLAPQKAHDRLLEAVSVLAPDRPALRAFVLGEGPERGALEARLRELDLVDRVRLPGARDDVLHWLAAADVYVTTSRWEGLSLALLEAMAAGRPVVATETEGTREVLRGGGGLLCPQDDPAALAGAIGRLVDDPVLREELGEAAARRAEDYSLGATVDTLEAMLRGCVRSER